jgi:hypothetical protein
MVELTITTSGPKPVKLLASGKKKIVHVAIASALVGDEDDVKATLKLESVNKDSLEDVLGTIKLGDVIICDISPESPD